MDESEIAPSPEEIRRIIDCINSLLDQTGPGLPPDFVSALSQDETWALIWGAEIVHSAVKLEEAFRPPPPLYCMPTAVIGWPSSVAVALQRGRKLVDWLLLQWDAIPTRDLSLYISVHGQPPPGVVNGVPSFPPLLKEHEREALLWSSKSLVEALQKRAKPNPEEIEQTSKAHATVPSNETLSPEIATRKPGPELAANVDSMTPGSRALGAAYQLKKEGKPVSLKAACALAGVDRKNIRMRYPEATAAIKALGSPDRAPRRGTWDRRSGSIDGVEEDEE